MYYSGFSNRNLLIAVTYDEIGNPLSYRDSYQFTWQNGRRLATVSHGSDSISYTYNPDGIRTSKTVSGAVTKFHTMNSTLLGQTKGSDTIVFLYDEKGNKYGFDYNGTKYYYIFNVQGDVIGILNQAGQKIVSYTYDPWGKVQSVDGSEASAIGQINPIRYRGYYYDTETGFYYLQSRYYDPTVRRFLNADAVISGVGRDIRGYNMFSYCMNNPVNLSDNIGNWPQWIKNVVNTVTYIAKTVVKAVAKVAASNPIRKTSTESTSSFVFANHVSKTHLTTPTLMLDAGPAIGKVGLSMTATVESEDPGLFHSYVDIGNDESKYGVGIDIKEWLGVGVGASSAANVYVTAQVTPWVHAEASVGFDGIGVKVGLDIENTSYDLEIKGGLGLILIFAGVPVQSSQYSYQG